MDLFFPDKAITIPFFHSEAERAKRFADWVASGGAMRTGMYCLVGVEGLYRFESGAWTRP